MRETLVTLAVAMLGGGLLQLVTGLLRHRPELAKLDAETESLRLATADRLIVQLDAKLERAEQRERTLRAELDTREVKIAELEDRLHATARVCAELQHQLERVQADLAQAERELAALRDHPRESR